MFAEKYFVKETERSLFCNIFDPLSILNLASSVCDSVHSSICHYFGKQLKSQQWIGRRPTVKIEVSERPSRPSGSDELIKSCFTNPPGGEN